MCDTAIYNLVSALKFFQVNTIVFFQCYIALFCSWLVANIGRNDIYTWTRLFLFKVASFHDAATQDLPVLPLYSRHQRHNSNLSKYCVAQSFTWNSDWRWNSPRLMHYFCQFYLGPARQWNISVHRDSFKGNLKLMLIGNSWKTFHLGSSPLTAGVKLLQLFEVQRGRHSTADT